MPIKNKKSWYNVNIYTILTFVTLALLIWNLFLIPNLTCSMNSPPKHSVITVMKFYGDLTCQYENTGNYEELIGGVHVSDSNCFKTFNETSAFPFTLYSSAFKNNGCPPYGE